MCWDQSNHSNFLCFTLFNAKFGWYAYAFLLWVVHQFIFAYSSAINHLLMHNFNDLSDTTHDKQQLTWQDVKENTTNSSDGVDCWRDDPFRPFFWLKFWMLMFFSQILLRVLLSGFSPIIFDQRRRMVSTAFISERFVIIYTSFSSSFLYRKCEWKTQYNLKCLKIED